MYNKVLEEFGCVSLIWLYFSTVTVLFALKNSLSLNAFALIIISAESWKILDMSEFCLKFQVDRI